MEIVGYQEKYGGEVIELWFKCKLVVPSNNPRRDIERKIEVDRQAII
ncbi:MAG: hypothetical protein QNL14_03990 [Deltaproteobacteria bacterium]|jgi:hypothetical protein|nr:hypothetical protein [Deltaproteobacteria bacterium]